MRQERERTGELFTLCKMTAKICRWNKKIMNLMRKVFLSKDSKSIVCVCSSNCLCCISLSLSHLTRPLPSPPPPHVHINVGPPRVYLTPRRLHALFPSICRQDCCWTLEMSPSTWDVIEASFSFDMNKKLKLEKCLTRASCGCGPLQLQKRF